MPRVAAKGGGYFGILPFLAIAHTNLDGIPPNQAHRARAPQPEILAASRGIPATNKRGILLNLEPRIVQNCLNSYCSRAAFAV